MQTTPTQCPYCGVGCGLLADVEDGRLTSVRGDPFHPANRGRTCRKPLGLPFAVHAPDRARVPLYRADRDARFEPAGWDDVLATLAARLHEIIAEHGPDSIAFYISGQLLTEDYYAINKLAKGFLGTNNVDANSRLCMSSAVARMHGGTQLCRLAARPPTVHGVPHVAAHRRHAVAGQFDLQAAAGPAVRAEGQMRRRHRGDHAGTRFPGRDGCVSSG